MNFRRLSLISMSSMGGVHKRRWWQNSRDGNFARWNWLRRLQNEGKSIHYRSCLTAHQHFSNCLKPELDIFFDERTCDHQPIWFEHCILTDAWFSKIKYCERQAVFEILNSQFAIRSDRCSWMSLNWAKSFLNLILWVINFFRFNSDLLELISRYLNVFAAIVSYHQE